LTGYDPRRDWDKDAIENIGFTLFIPFPGVSHTRVVGGTDAMASVP